VSAQNNYTESVSQRINESLRMSGQRG